MICIRLSLTRIPIGSPCTPPFSHSALDTLATLCPLGTPDTLPSQDLRICICSSFLYLSTLSPHVCNSGEKIQGKIPLKTKSGKGRNKAAETHLFLTSSCPTSFSTRLQKRELHPTSLADKPSLALVITY